MPFLIILMHPWSIKYYYLPQIFPQKYEAAMAAVNSALIIFTQKTAILNCNNISLMFLYFWSIKCSLGEQKRLLSETLTNLNYSKL